MPSERLDPVIASEPRCHAVTGALLMHDITVTSQRKDHQENERFKSHLIGNNKYW